MYFLSFLNSDVLIMFTDFYTEVMKSNIYLFSVHHYSELQEGIKVSMSCREIVQQCTNPICTIKWQVTTLNQQTYDICSRYGGTSESDKKMHP